MTSKTTIQNKISDTKEYLEILTGYKKYSQKKIFSDFQIKGSLERYLYLAVQSTIDLAEMVIAKKSLRKPTEMRENFEILKQAKIISYDEMERLGNMVGFRNALTHGYTDLDKNIIYDVLQNRLVDIKKFIKKIEKLK